MRAKAALTGFIGALVALSPAAASAVTGDLAQLGQPTTACISEYGTPPGLCVHGAGLDGFSSVAVTKDGKSVYLTSGFDRSVVILSRNVTTGALHESGCIGPAPGCTPAQGAESTPTSVAVSPNGKSVYVGFSDKESGAVVSFARNTTTGGLTEIGCISQTSPAGGECEDGHGVFGVNDIGVSADGKSVYTTAIGSGGVATFSRNATTGNLTETGCINDPVSDGCASGRGLSSAYPLTISPNGKSLYVASYDGKIAVLTRNTTSGALTQPAGSSGCFAPAGADGCAELGAPATAMTDVALSPDGKSLYVVSFVGVVDQFARNATTGALTEQGCYADDDVAGPCTHVGAMDFPWSIALSTDGKTAYIASRYGYVKVLSRNTTGGNLQPKGCNGDVGFGCSNAAGVVDAIALAVSPNNKSVYVAGGAGNIAAFSRAVPAGAAQGDLTQLGSPRTTCISETGSGGLCADGAGLDAVASVAISKDGKSVYAASFAGNAVSSFSRNATTGGLTFSGCISETGGGGCSDGAGLEGAISVEVSPDNKSVYVASYTGDAIASFKRSTTGVLTEAGCLSDTGSGGCADGVGLDNPTEIVASPNSKYAYASNSDTNSTNVSGVVSFSRAANGALVETGCRSQFNNANCESAPGLVAASGVAVSNDGKFVYVTGFDSDSITILAVDTATGKFVAGDAGVSCIGIAVPWSCTNPPRGLDGAYKIAVSPNGKNVYATGLLDNSVAVFTRNATTGALTQPPGFEGCISATGAGDCAVAAGISSPWGLAVSADGKSLYVATQFGDPIEIFARNVTTGLLTQPPAAQQCVSEIGAPGCAAGLAMAGTTDVAVSANNKSVYSAAAAADAVAAFSRATSG